MQDIRKNIGAHEIGEDARRQYMDALSTFTEWERSVKESTDVRGGMYWKPQGETDYLIRTSTSNSQKSLGPRSPETENVYAKFTERKASLEKRFKNLVAQLGIHKRLNRALFVGRAPQMLVDILARIDRAGIAEHFTVVGTHARLRPAFASNLEMSWQPRASICCGIRESASSFQSRWGLPDTPW